MTTHVRKKLEGKIVQKFIYEIQEGGALILSWKRGPYMNHTKLHTACISHWPNKGTLMFQGPEVATDKLNRRFRLIMRDEKKQDESKNEGRQVICGAGLINEEPKKTSKKEEEKSVTITRNQIGDILLFAR